MQFWKPAKQIIRTLFIKILFIIKFDNLKMFVAVVDEGKGLYIECKSSKNRELKVALITFLLNIVKNII